MKEEYRNKLRLRLANTAIGPSTIRRMAPAGTIDPARAFLETIDLRKVGVCNEEQFATLIDALTSSYIEVVPNLPWGAARKFLNIFLRDCLYCRFICEEYDLTWIERYLEVPLDGDVIKELKSGAGRGVLPRWNGVSKLTSIDSERFQKHAQVVADAKGVLRVDLDIEYWRGEKAQERKLKASMRKSASKIASRDNDFWQV
ncbi:hypothetical protein [Janthinobacterium tructae]